jgi:hypothetical protein
VLRLGRNLVVLLWRRLLRGMLLIVRCLMGLSWWRYLILFSVVKGSRRICRRRV